MRLAPAAVLALLLLPAAAHASAAPRVAQFGMDVPAAADARSASAGVTTAPLRAPRRYDLVGARWRSGAGAVWLRGRRNGGRWSRWVRLAPSEEPTRHAHSSEPVWAGGYDLVQVRTSRPLRGLHLSFVNAGVPDARAARTLRVPLPTGGDLGIVPRSAWGASRCRPREPAGYGRVDVAFVHHTETLSAYRRSQSASVVLAICLFHRNVNRWDDIGYNFLVDRFGQVFEGRAGGIETPAIGAQAGGFNTLSTGVAAIGDFRFRRLGTPGFQALAQLLAWKLSLSGVPAEGTVSVPSGGGIWTPFAKGTPVTLNRIAGHRDADSTACPGNALYAQLPALRRLVAQLEGPVSRLDLAPAGTRLVFPQPLSFLGRLTPAPGLAVPPGATVEIQDRLGSGGRTLAVLPLAADGSFAGSLPLSHDDVIQASFAGGGGLPRLVSTPVAVSVAPSLTLQASAPSVPAGSTVSLSGTVAPPNGRVTVSQEELRGGRFRLTRRLELRAANGTFGVTVGLPRAGSFRFTARTAASRLSAAGASAPVTVQVTG